MLARGQPWDKLPRPLLATRAMPVCGLSLHRPFAILATSELGRRLGRLHAQSAMRVRLHQLLVHLNVPYVLLAYIHLLDQHRAQLAVQAHGLHLGALHAMFAMLVHGLRLTRHHALYAMLELGHQRGHQFALHVLQVRTPP